jgi:uncharacterized protein (DUF885 family)
VPRRRRPALLLLISGLALSACSRSVQVAGDVGDTPAMVFEAFAALGEADRQNRWPDLTRAGRDARYRTIDDLLARIERLWPSPMTPEDRLSIEILRTDLRNARAIRPYTEYMEDLSSFGGLHNDVFTTILRMPARTAGDYDAILQRLDEVPALIDQYIEVLAEGLGAGYTQARSTVRLVASQLEAQMTPASASRILTPFRAFPPAVPIAEQQRLRLRADAVY